MKTTFRARVALSIATAAILALSSCARDGGVPTSEDIPEIMSEAAGTTPVSRSGDSPARSAVRKSFRTMLLLEKNHEAEVANRFQRPQLKSYFLLSGSYIGGTFPRETATLLREVQRLEQDYLILLQDYATVLRNALASSELSDDTRTQIEADIGAAYTARQEPLVEAHKLLESFTGAAAEIYELAARHPSSIKDMRTGLVIDDDGLRAQFNRQVDVVNAARDRLDAAVRALSPEHQASFGRMSLTTALERRAK